MNPFFLESQLPAPISNHSPWCLLKSQHVQSIELLNTQQLLDLSHLISSLGEYPNWIKCLLNTWLRVEIYASSEPSATKDNVDDQQIRNSVFFIQQAVLLQDSAPNSLQNKQKGKYF